MLGSRIQVDPNTGAGGHRLIGYSTHRKCLYIWPPAAGTVTISNEPNPAIGQGIVLQLGMPPYYVHLLHDGDVVFKEHHVIYSIAGNPSAFIETMSDD